jgi:hypothetical protein
LVNRFMVFSSPSLQMSMNPSITSQQYI